MLIVPTTAPETIEQYSIRVAEAWKIGRKKIDDGALLVIAKNDRKLRIEVGYGLEGALNDVTAKRIIDEIITPRFRSGDFAGGISAGVDRIVGVIDGETLPAPERGAKPRPVQPYRSVQPVSYCRSDRCRRYFSWTFRQVFRFPATGGLVAALFWFIAASLALSAISGIIAFTGHLVQRRNDVFRRRRQGWRLGVRRRLFWRQQFRRWRRRFQWRRWQLRRRRRLGELVIMGIKRIAKHLLANRSRVRLTFPAKVLANIEQAIKISEATHAGQIRFVVEGALDGAPLLRNQSARSRALDVFSHLRIWDTAHNNGVLIYLLLADHDVEIVADRGIDALVGAAEWQKICNMMEIEFRKRNFEGGVIKGIAAVSLHLAKHFPKQGRGKNELPDAPVVI